MQGCKLGGGMIHVNLRGAPGSLENRLGPSASFLDGTLLVWGRRLFGKFSNLLSNLPKVRATVLPRTQPGTHEVVLTLRAGFS